MSCPRFVQNAWKKDLCSNCFKGKEDHAPVVDNRARYLANLKEITKLPPPPSILKGVIRKNVSGFKVHFPSEESQIIGYGGDELSDHEEEELTHVEENGTIEEDSADEEDYKNFQKLTESNTEFNKDPANLSKPFDGVTAGETPKKSTTSSLKLGQIQNTSNGKKQTLLVSVQPFGSPASSTPLAVSRKTHLNNLLHDTADSLKLSNSSEIKTSSLPTIKPETEGDNKTELSCDKDSSQTFKCNVSLPEIPHVNNIVVDSKLECKAEYVQVIEPVKNLDEIEDTDKKTERNAENRLSTLIESKRSQITRGTILTKSHEQAKTKRYYQVGSVSPDDEIPISDSIYRKLESDIKSSNNTFSKAKDTIKLKTSFQHNNVKNIANGLFSSKLLKKEFGIQSDLQLTRMKSIEYIDSNPSTVSQGIGKENEPVQVKGDSILNEASSLSPCKLSPLESNLERTDKDEVLIIDGVPAESREMAGEPDGRADSDDTDEPPPDLPTTPPPLLTDHIPRPSFLHNLTKEKPKLPVKPKLREKSPPKDLALLDVGSQLEADPNLSPSSRHSLITKRQAPKPPPTPLGESPPKGDVMMPEESPPSRRERAASCSPLPSDSSHSAGSQTPEPGTRRSLSLSHEALANATPLPVLDKKKSNKMRSTLRKILRLASRDELKCEELGAPPLPPPRPRPEIIHPLDLNKSGVQVLRSDGSLISTNKAQSNSSDSPSSPTSPVSPGFYGRPSKPPPPPRSQSLDSAIGDSRPARPPPPSLAGQSVYVNLGEVRSAIAPAKPQRTASLREKDNLDSAYQPTSALQMSENLYESLAPECDLNRERSSLPYYGSETESDIYCPYTFANSLKGGEELRACKGRSVVHKNLEDNYGAVIVANHEALTQLLEQVSPGPAVPNSLRAIKSCTSLQWTDFSIDGGGEVVGGRVFLPASWVNTPVSLCLSSGQARLPSCFSPVTQFFDLVASQYLHQDKTELVQVSVAVLVKQEFMSLASLASQLSSSPDAVRESALVMVQVVNCLKTLQAQGREEASLQQLVLCREDKQAMPRVCLLPHDSDKLKDSVSLCKCALKAIDLLSLPQPLTAILRSVLSEERATSLTQAKAALELWLWGPTHVPVSSDTQGSLQRWLDLERANVLQSLAVRRPTTLNSSDYCHLSFLVRTNAKVMADALSLLDRPAASNSS